MGFHIVLHQPEIPQNTGNISRTCVVTGATLHIIKPTGFEMSDRTVRRAGLDYWQYLKIFYYDDLKDFYAKNPNANIYYASTKAPHCYSDIKFKDGDYIMFGKETKGLPEDLLQREIDQTIRIPMGAHLRSLNLSNSVAVILYEALRQTGFPILETKSDYLG